MITLFKSLEMYILTKFCACMNMYIYICIYVCVCVHVCVRIITLSSVDNELYFKFSESE